jgi:hypothetical protein
MFLSAQAHHLGALHLSSAIVRLNFCVDDSCSIAARVFDPDAIMFFVK